MRWDGKRALVVACGVVGLWLLACLTALAASPQEDVQLANTTIQQALTAARAGNLASAKQAYDSYENTWFDIEDGVRGSSRDSYVAIEKAMTGVATAFAATPPQQSQVVTALQALDAEQQHFVQTPGSVATVSAPGQASSEKPTVTTLLDQLGDAKAALARNDYATAAARLDTFQTTWLDVEGDIKTRSADAYRDTENDMALAASLAKQQSPQATDVVDRMSARLEPYREAQRYGIFDAAIILLREGLEALLVIAALSAVLKKSDARGGQAWLWTGAVAGLALSVVLGLAIQAFFSSIINPANRELMEGVIGLFAAVMLIYVSYWLHSKASIGGWQSYINTQTREALQGGRLLGIAVLAFLAVFREGAETALFYLGMASNISSSDLLIGLGIGFAGLAILGFLMVGVGVRIPMRPFFTVASVLVFYLCFKFVGTGIHALQVSGYLPAGSSPYLPTVDALGLYPTWPTTIAQLILLGAAAWVLFRDRLSRPARIGAISFAGALVAIGVACTATTPSSPSTAPVSATPAAAAVQAQVVPPAPTLTSSRAESGLVAGPRKDLETAVAAVQKNDIAAARAAMEKYNADWNGVEVYVNFRSRDLYGEIETHYEADITTALNEPNADAKQILPMLTAMIARYDEAIRMSDTGQPLSPLFDDLATLRTARAPLRTVSPALKAGDSAKAAAGYREFKSRWPAAQALLASKAPDALQPTVDALAQADAAMAQPNAESAQRIDTLLEKFNAGVNTVNTAARDAGFAAS
jgi:high-affinity iron transporter